MNEKDMEGTSESKADGENMMDFSGFLLLILYNSCSNRVPIWLK